MSSSETTFNKTRWGNISTLTHVNYDEWKDNMILILSAMRAYAIVTADDPQLQPLELNHNDNYDDWKAKEAEATSMIRVSCSPEVRHIVTGRISNGSGQPTSGPGWNRENGSVWFHTRSKTRTADSWWANPRPVPINPRISLSLARPVGSNLLFCVSGFTLMVAFRYATVNRKILTFVRHGSLSMY